MVGFSPSKSGVSILLVAVMIASILTGLVQAPEELDDEALIQGAAATVRYDLYFADAPGGHPTDGRITTERPDSGGQEEDSASGTNIEFSTDQMLSDITIQGIPNGNEYNLHVYLFLKATGPEGSTVDWTISLIAGSSIIGSEDWSTDACTPSLGGGGCGYSELNFYPSWTGNQDFTVDAGDRLKVVVSADMDCNSGGGNPDPPNGSSSARSFHGGTECDAWVAWNEIEDATGRFSKVEVDTNPVEGSLIKVQRPGSVWTDAEVDTWFPNDAVAMRVMQFNLEILNAFGLEDIETVRLNMIQPDGNMAFTHTFDDQELGEHPNDNAIRAQYNWSYQGGLDSGDYELDLEVINIQGKVFTIDHPTVRMSDYGVSLTHSLDRTVEYVAPGATTPISLDLRHVGASGGSGGSFNQSVELAVLTNLGSNWIVEFDRADRTYELSGGGQVAHPTLLLTAPSDLSGSPNTIDIRAVAYDSETVLVHQTTLQLDLEKLDTYAPPMASLWPEEHDNQYANSTGALNIDETIPRYVEDGTFTTFYLEIFNTGFDTDQFRIDVKQDSNANLQFWDNDTGQRIDEDEGDGTYHTNDLARHTTDTIRLRLKPSSSRDDPDIGLIELDITSIGNATQNARIAFTIQRTFGIQAQVVFDCDATPFGHVDAEVCLNSATTLAFDIEISDTMSEGDTVTDWLIVNPKDLSRNTDEELYPDANEKYKLWIYSITDNNGDPAPRVQLAPDDSTIINLDITLTEQVEEGNHTIYLRVREDIADESIARYFDLPLTILVGQDDPELSIHQISVSHAMEPDRVTEIQMRVKNHGNSEVLVLLDADVGDGWSASVLSQNGAQVVTVPAFSNISFTLTIESSEDALNGDQVPIVVTAKPLSEDESYPDDFTARKTVTIQVSINDPFSIITSEIFGDRLETKLIGIGVIVLLVAWIVGRRNRIEYIDEWIDEELEEDLADEAFDLPDPVDADAEDAYDDDEIELIDLD